MNAEDRGIGNKVQFIVGASATPVAAGYAAYACVCRIDGTKIASYSEVIDSAAVANTELVDISLIVQDYIPFPNPVTSITLTGATDSVALYLEPYND